MRSSMAFARSCSGLSSAHSGQERIPLPLWLYRHLAGWTPLEPTRLGGGSGLTGVIASLTTTDGCDPLGTAARRACLLRARRGQAGPSDPHGRPGRAGLGAAVAGLGRRAGSTWSVAPDGVTDDTDHHLYDRLRRCQDRASK